MEASGRASRKTGPGDEGRATDCKSHRLGLPRVTHPSRGDNGKPERGTPSRGSPQRAQSFAPFQKHRSNSRCSQAVCAAAAWFPLWSRAGKNIRFGPPASTNPPDVIIHPRISIPFQSNSISLPPRFSRIPPRESVTSNNKLSLPTSLPARALNAAVSNRPDRTTDPPYLPHPITPNRNGVKAKWPKPSQLQGLGPTAPQSEPARPRKRPPEPTGAAQVAPQVAWLGSSHAGAASRRLSSRARSQSRVHKGRPSVANSFVNSVAKPPWPGPNSVGVVAPSFVVSTSRPMVGCLHVTEKTRLATPASTRHL